MRYMKGAIVITSPIDSRDVDLNLVHLALKGKESAFFSLFQAHKVEVHSLCLKMTGDPAQADHLTQQIFLQAFRKLATFRGEVTMSTWLCRLAAATSLPHRRKSGPAAFSPLVAVTDGVAQRVVMVKPPAAIAGEITESANAHA